MAPAHHGEDDAEAALLPGRASIGSALDVHVDIMSTPAPGPLSPSRRFSAWALLGFSTVVGADSDSNGLTIEKLLTAEQKNARRKLLLAAALSFLFMLGEFVGGYVSNSLAVMTDAAHQLSDVASFAVSIFAIALSVLPSTARLTYGFHRAEVLGAVASVLILWVLTGVLMWEALRRIADILGPSPDANASLVDGRTMFIVAVAGVLTNVVLLVVLGEHGHSHAGGGGGHGHAHGAEHVDSGADDHAGAPYVPPAIAEGGGHGHAHGGGDHGHAHGGAPSVGAQSSSDDEAGPHGHGHNHGHGHGHGHGHNHGHGGGGRGGGRAAVAPPSPPAVGGHSHSEVTCPDAAAAEAGGSHGSHDSHDSHGHGAARPAAAPVENLIMSASIWHTVGDLLQSIGVVVAGGLIWWQPTWQIADPLTTLLFAATVLASTIGIMQRSLHVLMEGSPEGVIVEGPEGVRAGLAALPGVAAVHDLHCWNLVPGRPCVSAHLEASTALSPGAHDNLLAAAQRMLAGHGIKHSTLQVEFATCGPGARAGDDRRQCRGAC